MPRIFNRLSSELQAIAERRRADESVRQICEEYDDVLDAIDEMAESLGAATDGRYKMLSNLCAELEEEMIQLLQQQ